MTGPALIEILKNQDNKEPISENQSPEGKKNPLKNEIEKNINNKKILEIKNENEIEIEIN